MGRALRLGPARMWIVYTSSHPVHEPACGWFGENIYKISLTRRLEPMDRIRELGDSSVPFQFDVHALIFAEDAPALEHKLHKHFVLVQVNKVNHRKEFFRVQLADLRGQLESMDLAAQWTMTAAASDYRESLAIEAASKDNPVAREAWVRRQLLLEVTDSFEADEASVTVGREIENKEVGSPILLPAPLSRGTGIATPASHLSPSTA